MAALSTQGFLNHLHQTTNALYVANLNFHDQSPQYLVVLQFG